MKRNNNINKRQRNSLWGSLWDAVTSNYTVQPLWSGNKDKELTAKESDWLRLHSDFKKTFEDAEIFFLNRRTESSILANELDRLQAKKAQLYNRMSERAQEHISQKESEWFLSVTKNYANRKYERKLLCLLLYPKKFYWYQHTSNDFKRKLSDMSKSLYDPEYYSGIEASRAYDTHKIQNEYISQESAKGYISHYQELYRYQPEYEYAEREFPLNQSTGEQHKLTPDEIVRKAEQDIERLKEEYSRIDFTQPDEQVREQEDRIFAEVKAAEKKIDTAKSSNIRPIQQPIHNAQSVGTNLHQPISSIHEKLLRSQYWYQDNDITLILNKYLLQKGLHTIKVQQDPTKRGLILTQEQKLYKVNKETTQYSVSLGEPLIKGGSAAWESGLIDLLYQTIKAAVDWNQALLQEGILPESVKDQVIDNHYIAIPYCINNMHWITMLINFSVVKTDSVFHSAKNISVTCYDSLNMAQKITDETIAIFRRAFTNTLPEGINIDFKFATAVLKVAQQPDGSSCGVLTTDRIKNLIYGERLGILVGGIEKLDTKRILALREEHIKIAENELFSQKQLGEIRDAGIFQQYRRTNYLQPQQQQNLAAINAAAQTIHTCIMQLSKELANEVYLKVQEFIFAFDLLEKLNMSGSNINIQDPRYNNLLSVYNSKYEEHKSTIRSKGQEFVENNGEKLFFCADYAVRDKLKDLKVFMLKYKEELQLLWTTIFNEYKEDPEDLTWKDNGQDNFAAALKKVLEHISTHPKQTEVVAPSKPDIKIYPKTKSDEKIPMLQQPTEGYVENESDVAMEVCKERKPSDGFDDIYKSAPEADDCDARSVATNMSGSYVEVNSVEGVAGEFLLDESTSTFKGGNALWLYDTIVGAESSVSKPDRTETPELDAMLFHVDRQIKHSPS